MYTPGRPDHGRANAGLTAAAGRPPPPPARTGPGGPRGPPRPGATTAWRGERATWRARPRRVTGGRRGAVCEAGGGGEVWEAGHIEVVGICEYRRFCLEFAGGYLPHSLRACLPFHDPGTAAGRPAKDRPDEVRCLRGRAQVE